MNAATSPDAHDAARRRQVRQVAAQEAAPDRRAQGASSPRRRTAPEIAGRGGAARQARGARRTRHRRRRRRSRRASCAIASAPRPRRPRFDVVATAPSSLDGPTATHALYWLARLLARRSDPPHGRRRPRSTRRRSPAGEPPRADRKWPRRARGEQGGVGARQAAAARWRGRGGAFAGARWRLSPTAACAARRRSTRRRWRPCCTRTRAAVVRRPRRRCARCSSAPPRSRRTATSTRRTRPTPCGRLPSWVCHPTRAAAALAWRLADGAAAAMKPFELSSTAWALAKLHAAGRLPDELATAEVVNALHGRRRRAWRG